MLLDYDWSDWKMSIWTMLESIEHSSPYPYLSITKRTMTKTIKFVHILLRELRNLIHVGRHRWPRVSSAAQYWRQHWGWLDREMGALPELDYGIYNQRMKFNSFANSFEFFFVLCTKSNPENKKERCGYEQWHLNFMQCNLTIYLRHEWMKIK